MALFFKDSARPCPNCGGKIVTPRDIGVVTTDPETGDAIFTREGTEFICINCGTKVLLVDKKTLIAKG
jgi:DNA-directed RNA polymerase subunit RPC12/RpoP